MPQGQIIAIDEFALSFQRGEERGYDHFYRLYFKALHFFAFKILGNDSDAEDIVQDCFAKLWEKRVSVRNAAYIKSFLYSTVRNACLSKLQKASLTIVDAEAGKLDIVDDSLFEEQSAYIRAEMLRQIHESMDILPPRIKQVFQLFYLEGKDELEISALLKTSRHTIHNQRCRAVLLIRQRVRQLSFTVILLLQVSHF